MGKPRIFIKKNCLDILVASAIEVFPRETNGLLIGRNYKRILNVNMAYPIQTDNRKPTYVEHGNLSALNRLLNAMITMEKPLIGGFHSHPYPNGYIKLTKDDIDFVKEEIERIHKLNNKKMNTWLELVMSVKKKQYKRMVDIGTFIEKDDGKIRILIRNEDYTGFDIKIGGYAIKFGDKIEKQRINLIPN